MANVVINAELVKRYTDKVSGIASSVSGTEIVGVLDTRPITYDETSRHICGVKYDKNKKTIYMTDTDMGDSKNIGIFVTTYDLEVVQGRALIREEISNSYELSSVAAKLEGGGYAEYKDEIEIPAKKVNLRIVVVTDPSRVVLRNSKGVLFVCDFKAGKWFTMAPGKSESELYRMTGRDLSVTSLFKFSFPVPGLDRNLYDNIQAMESGKLDKQKHINENV